MEFIELTHGILRLLQYKGYTVLTSVSPLNSDDPTWYPEKVPVEELKGLNITVVGRTATPAKDRHLMLIDDALENIREEELIGQVFLD
ncbi:hypothetical protein [Sphingobacterium sp. LRF_L2]|uniref:hypothetical protein n=1 Tax=Sphingobacterium sp. LRF_L2 TaxID=3369421 RepID=UPI003F5D7F8A